MKKKIIGIFVCMLFMISTFATAANVKTHLHEDNRISLSSPKEAEISFLNDGPEEEWNVTFGGNMYDVFFTVQETYDSDFIALGGRDAISWDIGGDCWLVKIDENGDMLWDKTFGGSQTDNGHGLLQTSDGGFIISAITESYGAGSYDAWVIRTDADGNEIWNKTYGGFSYDLAEKTIPLTPEGDFALSHLYEI